MTQSTPSSYQQRKAYYDSIQLKPHQQAAKERNRPIREAETSKHPQEKSNERR